MLQNQKKKPQALDTGLSIAYNEQTQQEIKMTWRELKSYIEKQDEDFMDSDIQVYDFSDGSEYEADVTELLFGEHEDEDEEAGWVPYLTINQKEYDDENTRGETKETSVD
jgi:hypothetical protein